MKSKIKNDYSNIKLTFSHKELILLRKALNNFILNGSVSPQDVNHELYDCDEYKTKEKVENDLISLNIDITNVLDNINPY